MLVADERISPFFTEINKESLSWNHLIYSNICIPTAYFQPTSLQPSVHLPSPLILLSPPFNMSALAAARYGKDNVRVYKVHRDEKSGIQTVVEMTVCVLLEGDIETS